jgi:hypothetical protein
MSRTWNQIAAIPIDAVGIVGAVLIVLAVAALAGLAWRTYPRWLPGRSWFAGLRRWWQRLRQVRLPRWRRRGDQAKPVAAPTPVEAAPDALPEVPASELRSAADLLAAQGRFAEAVRERLRAIVRELVDTGVIHRHPEWTVTELARAAATARITLAGPLNGAGTVFSDIWYGARPATREHDERMRAYADEVHRQLTTPGFTMPAGTRR